MIKDLGRSGATRPIERQHVLVVDDEPDIREALKATIEAYLENVDVFTSCSGNRAVEFLKDQKVHLIITDYRMPGMDGIEFLHQAREICPDTPRIMITAYPDVDLAIRALRESQITNFIPKPLRRENIVVVVASTLHERRARLMRNQALASALGSLGEGVRELRVR